jgi:hypothetical protein
MTQLKLTADILTAALEGYEAQKIRIDAKIAEIKQQLNGGHTEPAAPTETGKPRKKRSAAVRRRMRIAQQLRWKKIKQNDEPPQPGAAKPKKRKLSAAGRRAIIAATKKRWAAVKAAKQAEKPPAIQKAVGKKAATKKAA